MNVTDALTAALMTVGNPEAHVRMEFPKHGDPRIVRRGQRVPTAQLRHVVLDDSRPDDLQLYVNGTPYPVHLVHAPFWHALDRVLETPPIPNRSTA